LLAEFLFLQLKEDFEFVQYLTAYQSHLLYKLIPQPLQGGLDSYQFNIQAYSVKLSGKNYP